MPVTAAERSTPKRLIAPSAMARTTSSLTAPWRSISSAGTSSSAVFTAVVVRDDAPDHDVGASRCVGKALGEEAAGA